MTKTIFILAFLFLHGFYSLLIAQEKTNTQVYSFAVITLNVMTIQSDSSCPPIPYFNLSAKPPLFSTTTDISFELPSAGIIAVRIFDFSGRVVRTIVNSSLDSGWHHFTWNGSSDNGALLASGYYTCIASGFGKSDFAKIDLVR